MKPQELVFSLRVAATSADPGLLRSILRSCHPAAIARSMSELETPAVASLLRAIRPDRRGGIFGYLEPEIQDAVAARLNDGELGELLACMSPDEQADVWLRLPEDRQETVLQALDRVDRDTLKKLSSYPEGTVGSLMTTKVATLPSALTVADALPRVRAHARDAEDIYTLFILGEGRRLVGTLSVRDLLLSDDRAVLGELCRPHPIHVQPRDPFDDAIRLIRDYDMVAIPVVDHEGSLLGAVTHDDASDAQELREAVRLLRLGGVTPVGRGVTSLLKAPLSVLYRKRITWLLVLIAANLFSGAGILAFEDLIAKNAALVVFLPLLIDSGGNAGSQAATLTIRSLAVGEVKMRDWWRLLLREVGVASMLGGSMALAVSLLGLIRGGIEIAIVVSLSMAGCVLIGSLVGAMLPFVLRQLRLDPAAASTPLVTSICDALGVLIYFGLASVLLGTVGPLLPRGWAP
ncbi:MAG: magnesium transporter [Deltaproteobacteria bacterium]|nr:MAG: magnesium transporter [Deltaproteobacteria bacterium]